MSLTLRSSLPKRLVWALMGLLIIALMVSTFGCAQKSTPPSSSPAVSLEARYWKVLQEGVTPNSGVLGLTDVIAAVSGTRQDIMFGLDYGLALKSDGTVWSWIINVGGGQQASDPAQESKLSEIKAICTGTGNSLALDSDGNVWYWYAFGDLPSGIPSPTSTSPTSSPIPASQNPTPTQVMGLGKVTAISAGQRYSLVLQNDGTVWAWGENEWGQLGDGTTTNSDVPVQVRNLSDVIAISAGHYHSLALKSDGTVWAWGDNESGELGNGTTVSSNVPVQVSGLDGIVAIAAGEAHSLALKKDGTVWSWGNNENGQAGNGAQSAKDNPAVVSPVKVSNLSNVIAIVEGGLPGGGADLNGGMVKYGAGYCLALKSDDTVWTWGASGWYSEPWNNPHNNIPVQINNLSDVKTIVGGGQYAIAIVLSSNASSTTPALSPTPPNPTEQMETPDDIVYPPGGPAYRANVHQAGVPDRWPSIQSKDVTLKGPSGIAQVSYRDYIESKAGQTRNNIISVYLPDAPPVNGTKAIELSLEAVDAPEGISLTYGDNVHLADPARRTKTVLKIAIAPQVTQGEYNFNIGVKIDGEDYGTVPCTIKVN